MEKEKKSPGILIFAGTTEGRELAEYMSEYNVKHAGYPAARQGKAGGPVRCFVRTATEYGKSVLGTLPGVEIHAGRMDAREIRRFIEEKEIDLVIDATHPFAREVTENIKSACEATSREAGRVPAVSGNKVRYVRCLREGAARTGDRGQTESAEGQAVWVDSVSEAAAYLKKTEGNILIATGSKELHLYTEIEDYKERCFARVLSTREAVEESVRLGFEGRHLIAMQGPFSVEMNLALLKQTEASWFVTKESGAAGGFEEKVKAAQMAGASAVIIGKPEETGESVEQIKGMMRNLASGCGEKKFMKEADQ